MVELSKFHGNADPRLSSMDLLILWYQHLSTFHLLWFFTWNHIVGFFSTRILRVSVWHCVSAFTFSITIDDWNDNFRWISYMSEPLNTCHYSCVQAFIYNCSFIVRNWSKIMISVINCNDKIKNFNGAKQLNIIKFTVELSHPLVKPSID